MRSDYRKHLIAGALIGGITALVTPIGAAILVALAALAKEMLDWWGLGEVDPMDAIWTMVGGWSWVLIVAAAKAVF